VFFTRSITLPSRTGGKVATVKNGGRPVNIHTKFVGAIDAVVLSLTAAITVAMVFALLSPHERRDDLVKHYSVTIEQLPS
jgi:hypothetical protein